MGSEIGKDLQCLRLLNTVTVFKEGDEEQNIRAAAEELKEGDVLILLLPLEPALKNLAEDLATQKKAKVLVQKENEYAEPKGVLYFEGIERYSKDKKIPKLPAYPEHLEMEELPLELILPDPGLREFLFNLGDKRLNKNPEKTKKE